MSTHREYNPYTGATEEWKWDAESGSFAIRETFDVTSILEANKVLSNSTIDKRFGGGMMHHVAEIPNAFIVKFKTDHNLDIFSSDPNEQKRLRKLLESPEYRFLKTTVAKLWRAT